MLDPNAVATLQLVYMESRRFPELGKLLYDRGAGRCFTLMQEYIRQQCAVGALQVADIAIAAEQFMDMITGRLLMRAALGLAPNPPALERKLRVDAAVDVFLAAYAVGDLGDRPFRAGRSQESAISRIPRGRIGFNATGV